MNTTLVSRITTAGVITAVASVSLATGVFGKLSDPDTGSCTFGYWYQNQQWKCPDKTNSDNSDNSGHGGGSAGGSSNPVVVIKSNPDNTSGTTTTVTPGTTPNVNPSQPGGITVTDTSSDDMPKTHIRVKQKSLPKTGANQ